MFCDADQPASEAQNMIRYPFPRGARRGYSNEQRLFYDLATW
jgi:hypothetical protein